MAKNIFVFLNNIMMFQDEPQTFKNILQIPKPKVKSIQFIMPLIRYYFKIIFATHFRFSNSLVLSRHGPTSPTAITLCCMFIRLSSVLHFNKDLIHFERLCRWVCVVCF